MSKAVAKAGRLDVRLFGHLDVALDGVPFNLATPRKTLAVLTYLWLHRNAPVSREYLAFLLYPDDEESSARAKLRATLSELPKILPQPADRYVSIDADKVFWNPKAGLWLDVDAFEAAASDRTRLGDAIEIYRGDLLPEIYDEWLDTFRERYRNAYLRCLTERVSEARRNANLPLAIETARKVLTVDPWREDVVRRVIAMRFESGDRAGALSEYAAFAKRLQTEMGAQPMAETAAVAEQIRGGHAPTAEEPDDERRFKPEAATLLPFVGRHDDMERLLETWSRVARGRGACAFVGGLAGIGKSRVALEFAHAVEERGGRVLFGTTSSPEATPYECVVDALRSAPPLLGSLKPSMALACVATLVPEIGARAALPDVARLDAESERIRLFESLFRCVAELAGPRPLLLVLEDLHSAQSASLDLLQFLVRRVVGARVMILATYRDEESPQLQALHRLRREARATAGTQSIWLNRLSLSDIEELRKTLPDVRDRPAETLMAASQGNPFFLTQLVVEVREHGDFTVPSSLEEVVARRVDRLSERARTAAEIAACIGDRFSREAVREVSAWDDVELSEALDELLDRRIVHEAGGRGFLEYTFAHHLVQEAIAQAMPAEHAAVRRRRVARVLERLYPERFSELSATLAAHYEAAGDAANATRCYLEAVRRSISIGALQEARTQSNRALALDPELRSRADLLLERVTIEARSGNRESRNETLSELERIDAELGDPVVHRAALLRRIEFAAAVGERAEHERAVAAFRDSISDDDPHWNAEAYLAEAKLAYALGDLSRAYASNEAALACSRVTNDLPGTARALCALAQVEALRGHLSAADALFDEAAQAAAEAADPVLELLAYSSGWHVAYQQRAIERCRSASSRCVELAVKLGDRPAEARAHDRLGASFAAGAIDAAAARQNFQDAARIYAESGNVDGSAGPLLNQAVLETRIGFVDRGLGLTERAVEFFERARDLPGLIAGIANLVFLYAQTGEVVAAREAADRALGLARQRGFGLAEASILENLASAEGAAGNYARAIEIGETSLDLRRRAEAEVWSVKTLAEIAIWNARIGNPAAARDAITRMLTDEDAIARGSDHPSFCHWIAAQIFHREGREAEASRQLARARRLVESAARDLEPEDRQQFLSMPWHVDLQEAVSNGIWPDPPR